MERERGGLRVVLVAVRPRTVIQLFRRAATNVDRDGEPNARCQYVTNDASAMERMGGEVGKVVDGRARAVEVGLGAVGGGGIWKDHKFSSGLFEPSRKGRGSDGE